MPRGGRRPGAGAPKGNWNALTTGLRSKRLQDLVLSLRDDPQFVAVYRLIIQAAARKKRRDEAQKAKEIVAALAQLLERQQPNDREEPTETAQASRQQ
jgi:hypothetical protein